MARLRRPEWMTKDEGKRLRQLIGWLAVLFFAMILWLSFAGPDALGDRRTTLTLVAVVVGAVWFVPHIAILRMALSHDGAIDFGPLGKHEGRAKQATLLLIFAVEAVLLPLALALGWGRW